MKNGSRTTIMYEKNRGQNKIKLRQRWQTEIDAKVKSNAVCVCGGIGKESFTTSCCRLVKRLILTSTVNN